jgi:hypothetical protein
MKKKDLMFIAMALGVIGLFVFLSLIGRKPKPLSPRPEHASVTKDTPRETCLECHAPGSPVAPMPDRHPKKGRPPDKTTPCYACHKYPTGAVAAVFKPSMLRIKGDLFLWLNQQHK